MAVGVAWLDSRSGSATPVVPPVEVGKRFTLAESPGMPPNTCWMAINGKVYDLSAYLPEHPSRPDMHSALVWPGSLGGLPHKMKGRPQSGMADQLLETYVMGSLLAE